MSSVDPENSQYQEVPDSSSMYNEVEVKHLRFLLRRLRFLEKQVRERGGLVGGASGGAAFAEWERDALAFVLTEMDFIESL